MLLDIFLLFTLLFSNKSTAPDFIQGGSEFAKPLRTSSDSTLNNAPGIQPIAFVGAAERAR